MIKADIAHGRVITPIKLSRVFELDEVLVWQLLTHKSHFFLI